MTLKASTLYSKIRNCSMVLLLGCCVPAAAASAQDSDDAKAFEEHLEELGYRKPDTSRDPSTVVCKRQRKPGSAMTRKVCRTREQWEYITRRSQDSASQN